ncbi:MAG: Gfo/Idh/MocA family oxidoreductase [Pyrinomonadaceae bacterium]
MIRDNQARTAPVRVGIIGAGNVLWAYLQVLDRLIPKGQALLGPVCVRSEERRSELYARRPGIHIVEDAQQVLTSNVDVVLIITSPDSHAQLARRALEHGKHVVVEKPLAQTRAEAEAVAELAEKLGLHLLTAPFVQLAPTFRSFWSHLRRGEIGRLHSARGLYGNAGSTWASWYHEGRISPLAEVGIYNLKSLAAILGSVIEVFAAQHTATKSRTIGAIEILQPGHDVSHVILRHESGALSNVVSSHAIQRYRRPALEIYGTAGTANLLGDDWDPRGFEIWRNETNRWENYEPIEGTWTWTDGLAEIVRALQENRPPLANISHDLHLLDVIEAADQSARDGKWARVNSRVDEYDLSLREEIRDVHHVHDHTRPADEQ